MPRCPSTIQRCLDMLQTIDQRLTQKETDVQALAQRFEAFCERMNAFEHTLQLLQDQVNEQPLHLMDEINEVGREVRMVQHDVATVQQTVIDLTHDDSPPPAKVRSHPYLQPRIGQRLWRVKQLRNRPGKIGDYVGRESTAQ